MVGTLGGSNLALLPDALKLFHGYRYGNTWRLEQPVTEGMLDEERRSKGNALTGGSGVPVLTVGQHILSRLRAFPAVRKVVECWRRNSGVQGDEAV